MLIMLTVVADAQDQASRFVLERNDRTIVLEPYADNIVRITMSAEKPAALAAPGYGIVGAPSMAGWTQQREPDGYDVIRSGRLVIRVAPENLPPPHAFHLDALNQSLRDHYFGGGGNGHGPNNNIISVATFSGKARATAFPLPLTRRKASIITASASSSKGFSTCAIIAFSAGTITALLAERTSAFLSWFPAAATASSGTTPPKRPSISASTS
jgi:alpha-glucosidase/alpha-D-xyloside xylohydrolase